MTRDAIAGNRLIAMALLKPDSGPLYATLHAPIYPEVCIGRIQRDERLPDGRYNILLQGCDRAAIEHEDDSLDYRRGILKQIRPRPLPSQVENTLRSEIRRLLTAPDLSSLAADTKWLDLLDCGNVPLSDAVDALASATLADVADKQQFLAEPCVARRGACLCEVLRCLAEAIRKRCSRSRSAREWPPKIYEN